MKLERSFYTRDTLTVARELLGKIIVHEEGGIRVSGRIVEVEAYMGPDDKAAHSYNLRKTERVMAMYEQGGTAYVFVIYGTNFCFNVVTREAGIPQAVLVRGVEPVDGVDIMSERRFGRPWENLTKREVYNLTNGPAKLCVSLGINKSNNKQDLLSDELYLEYGIEEDFKIGVSKRIGIDYAEEAKDFPWRFYIEGNGFVSK